MRLGTCANCSLCPNALQSDYFDPREDTCYLIMYYMLQITSYMLQLQVTTRFKGIIIPSVGLLNNSTPKDLSVIPSFFSRLTFNDFKINDLTSIFKD